MSDMVITSNFDEVRYFRNGFWANNPSVPNWVNIETEGLDRFFTKPEVAEFCYNSFKDILAQDNANLSNYRFIEPSCGEGAFYNLLPEERRTGIDLVPMNDEIIQSDFLAWEPKENGYSYCVIGNPPFGYRAWLALLFMNHAAKFSDYVGMILPMSFQSDGKGSPKHRVKGLSLLHSEILPLGSFYDESGKTLKINALWQVWKHGVNNIGSPKTCKQWLDLFTVDMRKERLCGHNRMSEADYFLQRTYFNEQPKLVKSFSDVKYVCGYGLVIKKEKRRIVSLLSNTNWDNYSNLAAHNCRHISMYHIEKVLTDAGLYD